MIKKIRSILLSLMMVLSVTAPFVFAETETGAQPDTAGAAEQGSSADDSGAGEEAADEGPAEQDDAAENGGQEETEGDDAGDEAAAVAQKERSSCMTAGLTSRPMQPWLHITCARY